MMFVSFLGICFFGLFAWYISLDAFHYRSIDEACPGGYSTKCRTLYHLAGPFFFLSLLMTGMGMALLVVYAFGFFQDYFAITAIRVLWARRGILNGFWDAKLSDVRVRRTFLGSVEFRAGELRTLVFAGLTYDEAESAVYWAKRGAASQ